MIKPVTMQPTAGMPAAVGRKSGEQATGFGEILRKSIDAVNRESAEANALATGLVSGQHANIDETMIAMEKASISFQMMSKVQAKVVSAYQELMRLQL